MVEKVNESKIKEFFRFIRENDEGYRGLSPTRSAGIARSTGIALFGWAVLATSIYAVQKLGGVNFDNLTTNVAINSQKIQIAAFVGALSTYVTAFGSAVAGRDWMDAIKQYRNYLRTKT